MDSSLTRGVLRPGKRRMGSLKNNEKKKEERRKKAKQKKIE
jgi:hypothetical protein